MTPFIRVGTLRPFLLLRCDLMAYPFKVRHQQATRTPVMRRMRPLPSRQRAPFLPRSSFSIPIAVRRRGLAQNRRDCRSGNLVGRVGAGVLGMGRHSGQ